MHFIIGHSKSGFFYCDLFTHKLYIVTVTFFVWCSQKRSRVPVTQATQELLESSACVGADCLMKLLGNYCRNLDIKTAITVGVVGKFFLHNYMTAKFFFLIS